MQKFKRVKRQFLTLIEMMIVMFIIALITGGLAYRYVGSLDESRAFKTKVAIDRVSGILNLKAADDPTFLDRAGSAWQTVIETSPLVANSKDLIRDGWGQIFQVEVNDDTINVSSRKYNEYIRKNENTMFSNAGSKQ